MGHQDIQRFYPLKESKKRVGHNEVQASPQIQSTVSTLITERSLQGEVETRKRSVSIT